MTNLQGVKSKMPYWVVIPAALLWLAVRHVRSAGASARSRRCVAGLAAASFLAPWLWSGLALPAGLLQVAVCFYVLLHDTVNRPEGR